ncbi:MAG TPA: BtpA/SgcQ family protein [Gammaproteobacteria bacterium]
MIRPLLPAWAGRALPVIGMLHLPPLPGAPGYRGDRDGIRDWLLRDLDALVDGGVDGLLLENFGDAPFHPGALPAHVVAEMTALACLVRARCALPLGINCLRNDGLAALAVAHAAGGAFIRVNVLGGARVTDQGVISGQAHLLLRERQRLGAGQVRILGDVDVKHSVPLGQPRPLEQEAADLAARGGADGLVVSGTATGQPTQAADLDRVRAACALPVLVGSGVAVDNVTDYLGRADALIVGSALKQDGGARAAVDPARVRALCARLR